MRIRLLAFASAGDLLGDGELELSLPDGASVADLRQRLEASRPGLAELWPRLAVAVGGEVVTPERRLTDGDEVALLPPVSGGSGGGRRTELTAAPIEVGRVAPRVAAGGRGATVLFVGTVRNHHQGRPVRQLVYTAYRPMAEERLERIARELAEAELEVAIVHRIGVLEVGEASVVIAAAAPHRAAAYAASRSALERLKTEVPIWKREVYADGSASWREEEPLTRLPTQGAVR